MTNDLVKSANDNIENMTIGDLMQDNDVEISKKGNSLKLRKRTNNKILTLEIRSYSDGRTISQSEIQSTIKKKDLHLTAKELRAEGKTQVEIAHILGISQPYVGKLLKID